MHEKNNCGCTDYFVRRMVIVAAILFVLFVIVSLFSGRAASALITLAFISLVVAIVGCFLLYCTACKPAKGADE